MMVTRNPGIPPIQNPVKVWDGLICPNNVGYLDDDWIPHLYKLEMVGNPHSFIKILATEPWIWWDLTFRNDGFINMSYQVAPNFAIWKSRCSTQKHTSNMALDAQQVIWTFLHYHQLQAMWLEATIFCKTVGWGQVVILGCPAGS